MMIFLCPLSLIGTSLNDFSTDLAEEGEIIVGVGLACRAMEPGF
jgi:hypothetical protein